MQKQRVLRSLEHSQIDFFIFDKKGVLEYEYNLFSFVLFKFYVMPQISIIDKKVDLHDIEDIDIRFGTQKFSTNNLNCRKSGQTDKEIN